MSATPRKTLLADLALSDSGFVFDPYSGGTFTANRTALRILTALREELPRPEIVERLRSEFQVNGADLESDLGEFLRLLVQQGLLPPDFSLESPESIAPLDSSSSAEVAP
jgi:PqqD family protein of HPr-rel-A system